MRAYDLILKKRNGEELTGEEIDFLIGGYLAGQVPDYQMSAFLMAVFFRGMSARETADLTRVMVASGGIVELSGIPGVKVDKHSTGGVGDKTTLVLIPLAAACGLKVAKMSGRGLGHTGGTLDKLESIPGFRVDLGRQELVEQVRRVGAAVVGQGADLVPADGKLYALRDVTGTVESIPLIASSVMSKKLAGGAQALVLDVKVGRGAFMKELAQARELALMMVRIATAARRKAVAVLTDMDQPLGRAVGNALEVREAIETLRGGGPDDLRELCLVLGSHMLVLGGAASDVGETRRTLEEKLADGLALGKLREIVRAQGGDTRVVDDPSLLEVGPVEERVAARETGFVGEIDALAVGTAAMVLGAGRRAKGEKIDRRVGVVLSRKVGHEVAPGDELARIYAKDAASARTAASSLAAAFAISPRMPPVRPLVLGEVAECL